MHINFSEKCAGCENFGIKEWAENSQAVEDEARQLPGIQIVEGRAVCEDGLTEEPSRFDGITPPIKVCHVQAVVASNIRCVISRSGAVELAVPLDVTPPPAIIGAKLPGGTGYSL